MTPFCFVGMPPATFCCLAAAFKSQQQLCFDGFAGGEKKKEAEVLATNSQAFAFFDQAKILLEEGSRDKHA